MLIATLLFSCGNTAKTPSDDPMLKEANDYHLKAMAVEKEIKPLFEELRNQKNGIQVQGRALTKEEMDFVDYVNKMETIYGNWEGNRLEVPGFEHEHDHSHHGHDHGHDHHHGPDVQLTPEQMLEVQKESFDDIKIIKEKLESFLNK